jgi:DNA-binding NarL/FixJ family response regulator
VTALAGGRQALIEWIAALRVGRERWPEELDLETGMLAVPATVRGEPLRNSKPAASMSADQLLDRITTVTGAAPRVLRRSVRGPRVNPERRFAVWAMVKAGLTYREVGKELRMSQAQVAKTMSRLRRLGIPAEIEPWIARWRTSEEP